jgi:antitoxin MazE
METNISKIGNSRGIIIPAHILKACGFDDTVDLLVENGKLVVSSPRRPRADWEARFIAAGAPHAITEEEQEWLDMPVDEELLKDWTW